MEEGQFENLPGKGKPLNLSTNPHADPAEDTLYRILSKNGCAPEWVELNKEIRSQISEWRSTLKKAWANRCNGDYSTWIESSEALKAQLRDINNKVSHYAPSCVRACESLRESGLKLILKTLLGLGGQLLLAGLPFDMLVNIS